MKKIYKILIVAMLIVTIAGIGSYVFIKYDSCNVFFKLYYRNPINFNGVYIELPQKYSYKTNDKKHLQIFICNEMDKGVFHISQKELKGKNNNDILSDLKKDNEMVIQDYEVININNNNGLFIKAKKRNKEFRMFFILHKDLIIGWSGSQIEGYSEFEPLLELVQFIEK